MLQVVLACCRLCSQGVGCLGEHYCGWLATFHTALVPTAQVLPSKDFSAEEAVRVQLEALKSNNQPW